MVSVASNLGFRKYQEAYKLFKGEVINLAHLHKDPATVFSALTEKERVLIFA